MSDDGSMRADKRKLTTTAKEGYVSFGHPSITVAMSSGERVAIDAGVVDLVVLMNGIPGIETKGSCQGEGSNYGYVQFMPDGTQGRAHASLYFMHHILRNMHSAWVLERQAMHQYLESTGSEHPDAYKFKFTAELGNGYVLKWSPSIYSAVLAAARKAAEDTRQDS